MPELWTPGMIGPLDDLVARIHRRIESFAAEHGLEQAMVSVELSDGALIRLSSLSPEPGYGFLTLVPHAEDGEPQELIVPLGAIRQLTLSRAEGRSPVGFSLPSE
jgi:phage-related baseplate assembly protein